MVLETPSRATVGRHKETRNLLRLGTSSRKGVEAFASAAVKHAGAATVIRNKGTKDILIQYALPAEAGVASLRALLRHYAPFFVQQGGFPADWGRYLLELADADSETFSHYLRGKDTRLKYDTSGLHKPWRTRFCYDRLRFCGTAFEGERWPIELNGALPPGSKGCFYWGVSEQIIEALRDGRLDEIARMEIKPGETHDQGKVFVLLSDGVALAWEPNETTPNPDLFAELFAGVEETTGRQETLTRQPDSALA